MNHNFTKPKETTENHSRAIKAWAKEIFALSDETVMMTTELACEEAFCPDVMTLIAFWDSNNLRKEYRIYKAMRFITQNDVKESKTSMLNVMINRELAEEQKNKAKNK
jgi:hypothetical protein